MASKITFFPGEIYFVHEFDFNTRERSKYTKIGLVQTSNVGSKRPRPSNLPERDSWKRLKEHQTGNPNILHLKDDEIVYTEAVNWVEAKLHQAFAKFRVSGEWFELKLPQRKQAVELARELSIEAAELPELQTTALKLHSTISNGKSIKPTAEILVIARDYLLARKQLSTLSPLQKRVKELFTVAVEAGEDVKGAATTGTTNYKPRMLKEHVEALRADNEKLYKKYLVPTEDWTRGFSFKYKDPSVELGQDFLTEVSSIENALSALTNEFNAYDLNEIQLRIVDLVLIAERQTIYCDLALRVACGKNLNIEGVCTWPRTLDTVMEFQIEAFQTQNPDLVERYVKAARSVSTVKPAKRKARPS